MLFNREEGCFRETDNDAVMEKADQDGHVIGVSILNLRRANMTETDLRPKLCAANVTRLEQVRAVAVESTGDVSVLHAPPIDELPLANVEKGPDCTPE